MLDWQAMSASALPRLVGEEPSGAAGIFGILELLARAIGATPKVSGEEEHLLSLIRSSAVKIGGHVLAATDLADLQSRVDEFVTAPELVNINREATRILTLAAIEEALTSAKVSAELVATLGVGPAARLEHLFPLIAAAMSAAFQLISEGGYGDFPEVEREEIEAVLYDPQLPVAVKRIILSGLRADVGCLAIALAIDQRAQLAPWLAFALVDSIVEGQRDRVRFLAALPGVHISTNILPSDERLDRAALEAQVVAAGLRAQQWLISAEEAGADVFFPDGDIGDEAG